MAFLADVKPGKTYQVAFVAVHADAAGAVDDETADRKIDEHSEQRKV